MKRLSKPKLGIALLFAVLAFSGVTYSLSSHRKSDTPAVVQTAVVAPKETPKPVEPEVSDINVMELLAETNRNRVAHGVGKLALSESLHQSAQDKCEDMVNRNYWAHNAPDGTEPWVFIQRHVTSYADAGENLERHYAGTTSKDVVDSWMKSPTHRAALLTPNYQLVGFGVCKKGRAQDKETGVTQLTQVHVVQHFIGF